IRSVPNKTETGASMRTATISLAILAAASVAAASSDGLTITSKVVKDGAASTATSYIAEDHARWSSSDGVVIIDPKANQMIIINDAKKTYSDSTNQYIDAAAAKMKEQMNSPEVQRAQEAMKNLPPEQRQRMEAAMGGMFAVDVHKNGTSRKIAGYNCEDWTVKIGQMSTTEECMTTEVKFPMQAYDMFRSMSDSMKSLMAAMGPMAKGMADMQEQMKKIKGFPLASKTTTSILGRSSTSSTEVTEIKRGAIPDSAWEIPSGYTKTESPMAQMGGRKH